MIFFPTAYCTAINRPMNLIAFVGRATVVTVSRVAHVHRRSFLVVITTLAIAATQNSALGNDRNETVSSDQNDSEAVRELDEIVVIEKMSAGQLRRAIIDIENEFYGAFNRLNSDDRYDIVCRKHAPVGSQIPVRLCKASLYWSQLSEFTEDGFDIGSARFPVDNVDEHEDRLQSLMISLLSQHDSLRAMLEERKGLRDALSRRRDE